jgi:hypothetical protein
MNAIYLINWRDLLTWERVEHLFRRIQDGLSLGHTNHHGSAGVVEQREAQTPQLAQGKQASHRKIRLVDRI